MVDHLADAARWWTVLGAALAIPLIVGWARAGLGALTRESRYVAAGVMLAVMVGFVVAGTIIPAANDGRFAQFTQDGLAYRGSMMVVWFVWGCAAWGVSFALSKRPFHMLGGSIAWFGCCLIAVTETAGAML